MSQTGLESELDGMVTQYLRDVDHALAKLNPSRRTELVEEIEQHLAELRSQFPVHNRSDMENLLDRVGRPADIAAAALEDDDGSSAAASRSRTRRIVVVALLVVLLASLGIALALTTSPNKPRSPQSAPAVVTVPNVLGTSQAQAESVLQAAGLSVGEVQTASSTVRQGLVLSQSPQVGARMPRGSKTSLTVSSGPPVSATTPQQIATVLPSGIYLDGGSGTPHYYVALTSQPNGSISGAISFLYQDGQTSPVFSFSGPTNSGTATLTPSTGGNPISLTYSANQMQFGECTQYLKFATSLAQCTFTLSPGGNLQ
jgi:hypothetical protein